LEEATSMGAAVTAGVGIGAFGFDAVDRFVTVQRETHPTLANTEQYRRLAPYFEEIYQALCPIFETI
ncbi:MAG: xylulokinase, partial [Clostridia bacterium]|nr:xylulokinase [Clostridia bacterium]